MNAFLVSMSVYNTYAGARGRPEEAPQEQQGSLPIVPSLYSPNPPPTRLVFFFFFKELLFYLYGCFAYMC